MIVVDRSRREAADHCMRQRYWGFEYKGRGLERTAMSLPLLTGSMIHQPLGTILEHVKLGTLKPDTIDAAIQVAQEEFARTVNERGVMPDYFDGCDETVGVIIGAPNWQVEEQITMIQCLVKGWCLVRLPQIMAEYEIVAVELEDATEIADDMRLLTRADAILRHRISREYYILNFKTTADANSTWREQWKYDPQTLTEVIPTDERLGVKIHGVIIEGLIKGSRKVEYPRGSGDSYHNSPLFWCWKNDEGAPFSTQYSGVYEWTGPDGRNHRLGKGWQRSMASNEPGGISAWVNYLQSNYPETLAKQFVSLPPIIRSDYHVEMWKRSSIYQEQRIAAAATHITSLQLAKQIQTMPRLNDAYIEGELDKEFRMETGHGNCLRPGVCPFFDICWRSASPESGLYRPRTPNHPDEAKLRNFQLEQVA